MLYYTWEILCLLGKLNNKYKIPILFSRPNSGDCAAQRKNGDDIMTMSTASWGASTRSGGDLTSLSTGVSPLEIGISNPIPSIEGDAVRVTDSVNWATNDDAATTWKKETVTREPQENVLGKNNYSFNFV